MTYPYSAKKQESNASAKSKDSWVVFSEACAHFCGAISRLENAEQVRAIRAARLILDKIELKVRRRQKKGSVWYTKEPRGKSIAYGDNLYWFANWTMSRKQVKKYLGKASFKDILCPQILIDKSVRIRKQIEVNGHDRKP